MSFERCLRLAKAAKPTLLDKAQRLLFTRLLVSNLPSAQISVTLKTLAEHTDAGVQDLKRDWRAFEQLERLRETQEHRELRGNPSPYVVINGAMHHEKDTRDGVVQSPLCNFEARIVREEVHDDGAENATSFVIEGTLASGKRLPLTEVPAASYPAMSWVTGAWGSAPIVCAGQGTKDHLRVAIQTLSGDVPRHTRYGHVGWRIVDGEYAYLHAGGALGMSGTRMDIEVSFGEGRMKDYHLPDPSQGEALKRAIRFSLNLLELAPDAVTFPVLAATYRAPLCTVYPADLSLFVVGLTGTFKTELTALMMAHYGENFSGRNLPANWTATANALEKQAFLAKDALLVVDDFSPTGTQADVARTHRDAERLLRAQGNRAGRDRMRADGKLRPTYYPRGLVVSSGEDAPKGHSLRARIFFVEVKKGDIEPLQLSQAQGEATAGSYATAMAGYIRWLAPQMKDLKEKLDSERQVLRTEAMEGLAHRRTPDQVVSLAVGLKMFLQFGLNVGAITEMEQTALWERGWRALGEAAARQAVFQAGEDPVTRFAELLTAAIASGRAHLAEAETDDMPRDAERWGWRRKVVGTGGFEREEWQPQGERIGWVADDGLFLEPNAAHAVAQKLANAQGDNLSMAQRTLYKRMGEQSLILTSDRDRNTKRRTVAGEERATIHLRRGYLSPENVRNVQEVALEDGPPAVRTFRTVTEATAWKELIGKTAGKI